ncbi:desmoglein-2-like isoform X1 [Anarrhichthys ocellatus]|uniref:desmoglein-2-like isoform X1 n=1 Tax=Anarrhichthys ocellatus TaxID=433405 RepID=UPI0012ED43DE|nr:desmoglein-2-like isoform X1 [Anarrhichthys ocellatus]
MAPLRECSPFILLAIFLTLVPVGAEGKGPVLRRQKREWIVAPRQLFENNDYTGLEYIAKIRSDKANYTKILYYLTGSGVDQSPQGIFRIDENTGFVKIYSILDREQIPFYNLKGIAKFTNGTKAEKDIELNIKVLDVNDCPPIIKVQQVGSVNESSAAGTVVMRVIATDDDEAGTLNSKMYYRIVEQSNTAGMFFINSQTGEVHVRQNTLDRERQDTYTLTVQASDLNGQSGGNTGSGEIVVKILDINDNIPTLEQESYEGSVQENTVNVEVMRIKAIDKDLIHTDNWLAVYEIISGNEAGYFHITTDSKTNEGIIMIHKALDYEEQKLVNLQVAVSNKAAYSFATGAGETTQKAYNVNVNVINQKEGPRFQPSVKVVTISEDHSTVSIKKVIANYAAIDSDTLKTATNVRYAKIKDDDNWLIIDEKTADIRLNKLPDRESKFLINGTYYAKIICISNESPSKTATGTIAIQVEDFNDHCPTLTATSHTMCLEDNVIYVTAVDEDEFPNSAPFEFTVIEGSKKGKWTVEHLNETTVILRDQANLWPGTYKVAVEVKDQQGKSCDDVQMMDVIVCNCDASTKSCRSRTTKTAGFGASGILLLLLGLLLLLLLPLLLLFCLCGGAAAIGDFKAIPFDTKQQLISYHTEGQGEDRDVPLLHAPAEVDLGTIKARNINTYEGNIYQGRLTELGGAAGGGGGLNTSILTSENMDLYNQYRHSRGQVGMDYVDAGMMTGQGQRFSQYRAGAFDGMALSDQFLGEYYSSKSDHAAHQSQQKDGFLVFDYEGQESLAGSVGCCSLLENDNDLAFLNDLGPKFKTLAEICQGSTLVRESVDARVSFSPPRPVSPVWPSMSSHTHVSTHAETTRDRDHMNINTLNTSNVASGSSTIVQEERITERAQGSATAPTVHVQDNIVIPSQTLLMQQPTMYYAASPMYVVEPNPQMVLVAGGTQQAVGQVGLSQGLVQVGGLQGSQGLMQVGGLQGGQGLVQVGGLQGSQRVVQVGGLQGGQGLVQVGGLQGSQGVVLVDRQVGMGGVTGQVAQGLSQGTLSRSRQVLLVENGSSGGEQVASLAQGIGQTGYGSAEQGSEIRGQGFQLQTPSFSLASHGSSGSNEEFALKATPKLKGSQRVVVQRKKVSVTERNIESSTRA